MKMRRRRRDARKAAPFVLSADKVNEAAYFVGLLEDADPEGPEFRYLFSAALSAIRSFEDILSADFRRGDRATYEAWWSSASRAIYPSHDEWSDLRDCIVHEGSRFPQLAYVAAVPDGAVEYMHIRHSPANAMPAPTSVMLQLRGAVPAKTILLTSDPSEPLDSEAQAAISSLYVDGSPPALPVEFQGLVLADDPSAPIYAVRVVIDRLKESVDSMREIQMHAALTFGAPGMRRTSQQP